MRLRIVHQLSLLLLCAVVLAVLAVGGVVVWNLRTGFGDYLRARDAQQMERLAALVAEHASNDPSMDWLRGGPEAMRSLMDEFSRREGLAAPAANPRGGPPNRPPYGRPPPEGSGPEPGRRPNRPPNGPPGGPRDIPPGGGPNGGPPGSGPPGGSIGPRTQIFDADGEWIAGREQPQDRAVMEEAVRVQGRTVALLRVTVEADAQGVDARFLRRQYLGLAGAALATVMLSLVAAILVARRWSRPLRALQHATQRIAHGELGVRLPVAGASEIAGLTHDVNAMAESLQKLEAARRSWIAQISHELRTPLAVLKGELESIEDGARQPTPQLLRSLQDEVQQLIRLVNDLHTLAVADLGQLPCTFMDGDASALLTRVAQRYTSRLAKSGIDLELYAVPPIGVRWDFGRIEQLLTNLLENALRYTHAPGRVQVSWAVQHAAGGPQLQLTVQDTPPGVRSAELGQLFEPLYRADTARTRGQHHGSGLGLAIARAIVQAHGGSIAAQASPLGGLAVITTLPLDAEPL